MTRALFEVDKTIGHIMNGEGVVLPEDQNGPFTS